MPTNTESKFQSATDEEIRRAAYIAERDAERRATIMQQAETLGRMAVDGHAVGVSSRLPDHNGEGAFVIVAMTGETAGLFMDTIHGIVDVARKVS